MNKSELVTYIAENSEDKLSKKQAELAVDLFGDGIVDALKKGEKVQLVGLLTAEPVGRAERKGHNPQSGEGINIEAKMSVKTKPGKRLEDAVLGLNIADFLKKKKKKK
jgi:DNA-binding protein HU-beta